MLTLRNHLADSSLARSDVRESGEEPRGLYLLSSFSYHPPQLSVIRLRLRTTNLPFRVPIG